MSAELHSSRPENHESTLILTLSNPGARNALHPDMYAAGIEAIDAAERDPSLRAIVLTGANRFFCAGSDLNQLRENRTRNLPAQAESSDLLATLIIALRQSGKPVIAAVEGMAANEGFALALAADLIVAADDAQFAMSYARAGLTPEAGSSWFLANVLPRPLATELMFEGKPVSATRLAQLGVVNRLAKPGTVLDTALAWADALEAVSPNVITHVKTLVNTAGTLPLAEHLAIERDSFMTSLHHRDSLEGISAFLEKRTPVYR